MLTVFRLSAWVLLLVVLVGALRRLPWGRIRGDRGAQAVLLGGILALLALRLARIELAPGLDLHLIGATIAALVYGWAFGLYATAIATLGAWVLADRLWLDLALDLWLTGALPVLSTTALLDFAWRRLPDHPMIYLYFNACLAAALSIVVAQLGKAAVVWAVGLAAAERAVENFVLTLPAMMFAEAFLTGGTLIVLVSWRPRWVATFHDARYLERV